MCDRRRDLRSIACEVGISFGTVQSILTEILGMSKVSTSWVQRMLTNDQKSTQLDISKYHLSRYEDDVSNFIERVVSKMRHWFITLTQSQICRVNKGSKLAHLLLRNLRVFIQQGM